ncbi:MAG: metal-dependent phosphohydrolase [Cyanobacteria bacterium]|nr:metal-dependent phosphohydrolase [Cyanobacteriota bacterium]
MLPGSILKQLAESRDGQGSPLQFGTYYKNTLVALCHALEDSIETTTSEPLVVAAFQMGKWYLEEADRYRVLADRACHTTILAAPCAGFGDHPTASHPKVSLIGLDPADPVAQEWHLAIFSPTYQAMVLCQELTAADYGPEGVPTEDLARKFYGLWTFEPGLVQEAIALLIEKVAEHDDPLAATLRSRMATIAAAIPDTPRDNPGEIVARVVSYLEQAHHQQEAAIATAGQSARSLDLNLVSNELQAMLRLAELVDLNDPENPAGAAQVATLCEAMGELLDLPAWQLKRLRLAALLHRVALMQPTEPYWDGVEADLAAEPDGGAVGQSCTLDPAAQILRSMPRLRAIAQIVSHRTERWDGKGGPAGLAGDAIPLESRLLALAAHFQAQLVGLSSEEQRSHLDAILETCSNDANRWDPKLLEILTLVVRGMQQGWSLPVLPVKVASGLWLLDDDERGLTPATLDLSAPVG